MPRDRDEELTREIEQHLALEAEERMAEGMSAEDARHAARRAFGSVTRAREDVRAVWIASRWADEALSDVRYAVRTLVRNRSFAVVTLLMLGLGIGANTAIYSLMDQVVLRPLPVHQPDDLILLDGPGTYQGRTQGSQVFSVPMFRGLQAASAPLLSGMFARFPTAANVIVNRDDAELVQTELVSGDYFGTLGVEAILGRTLGPSEDRVPGDHPVIVLSHEYWQRRFGGDERVVNRVIRVNGQPMTIVGVAPAGFTGIDPAESVDLFVPLMMKGTLTPTWNDLDNWRSRWVHVMGRLEPGVSRDRAAASLDVTYRQLLRTDLDTVRAPSPSFSKQFLEKGLVVNPGSRGRSPLRADFSTPLIVLMGMVGLLLLVACGNVANLLLARAAAQQREVAIRQALGAGRLRVVRQRLAESAVLAAGGGAIGLLIAWGTTRVFIDMLPFTGAARQLSAAPDLRVALFGIGVAGVTALLCGLAPALHATKPKLAVALKEETGRVVGAAGRSRIRRALVVAQVALSILLLAGAGLFVRSLYNLRSVSPGFVADGLLQFRVNASLSGYARERAAALFRTLEEQLSAVPGVVSVSAAVGTAMDGSSGFQTVRVQGYQPTEGQDMSPSVNFIGPDYFTTMGMPLVSGREFDSGDHAASPKVAIVNETMARYFWGAQSPIGRRFGTWGSGRDDGFEIVGVVKDAKFSNLRDEIPRFFYLPYMQADSLASLTFYLRHRTGVEGLSTAVRQVITRLDPSLPMFNMKTMQAQVDESLFLERVVALLSMIFGGLATVLAAVGLYGVMSYAVTQRTREIGVRVALGADRASVLWMVLREVILLAGAGILLGIPVALGLSRLVQSQLFGLSPADPLTIAGAALTLSVVALLAGYLPARRATRMNPLLALRYE
jgi:predicted permease